MLNKRKIISLMLFAVMLCGVMSGCGKDKASKDAYDTVTEIVTVDGDSDIDNNSSEDDGDLDWEDASDTVEDDEFDYDDTEDDEKILSDIEKPLTTFEATKFGTYKYVWGDEFNGNSLDTSKFTVRAHSNECRDSYRFDWGSPNLSKVFNVSGGCANEFMRRWYDPLNSSIEYASSGGLNSVDTMSYRYGYLEVRSKMTFQKDANAIWLVSGGALGANASDYCGLEVDVFETLASYDSVTPNVHRWYADGRHTDYNGLYGAKPYTFFNTYNLSNEFHKYGFLWTPTEMSMYVDDEKYWTLDTTKSFDKDGDTSCYNLPMYLMISCGAFTPGSTWEAYPGDEVDVKSLPLSVNVDWVRLYQDPSVSGNILNTK